ncbi:MAG: hypothetical protein GY774_35685 [Planctomycetes bacterium]|nr:hypothetical protein [Planctomycetota bacterium]
MLDTAQIPEDEQQRADIFAGFFQFKTTPLLGKLISLPHKTIGIFSGNQGGKTSTVAQHYVLRLLGKAPVEDLDGNPLPNRNNLMKKVRCMSSSLPEDSSAEEQDNTQYLELKKRIPPELIIKDITARAKNLVVRRPLGLNTQQSIFEFRSFKQELQDLGKIQLSSAWNDEEPPRAHREEGRMRLLAEDGDEIFTLTPEKSLTYTFDEIWQNANYIFRTDAIVEKFNQPQEEFKKTGHDIACIQMATDDNPELSVEVIDRLFGEITDPVVYNIRRYGVFAAIAGRIHKAYNPAVSYISYQKYFPNGVPYDWMHCRGIDYHESRTPWSVGWVSISPDNEWFLWQEFHPAIDGANAYSTYDISRAIVRKSGDYFYTANLIDPLAKKKQANTLFSTVDDLNRYFDDFRKNEGLGTPTFWEGWDTKGTGGRDNIGMRFKNAVRCGAPFNNKVKERGRIRTLPTIWICDTCPKFHKSIMTWRYGEFVAAATKAVNDPKNEPQQKNSHDNMVLECLAKDQRAQNAKLILRRPVAQSHRVASVTGRP